ncbi:MAG: CotH kinase family protein, partial [Eubacterium sp.]|nr:CotH kinase family protein [Eubacterium sp.]
MMKKSLRRCMTTLLMTSLLVGGVLGQSASSRAHGTADHWIEEKEINNVPPKNYKITEQYQGKAKKGDHNKYFLKDDLQTVSLKVDENNLNYLFQNAGSKPTVMAESVTIGDETLGYVGLKSKGNYTLRHTYNDYVTSDRFSFTINFGKYINEENYGVEQNFHGCDKISFNNFFFDKSMLKEYAALTILSGMGLPTPQFGLAKLYINDKYYGVYFMLESMDRSILKQYLDKGGSELAKFLTKPTGTKLQYDKNMDKYLNDDGKYEFGKDLKVQEDGSAKADGVLEEQKGLWNDDDGTLGKVKDELSTVFTWQKKLNQLSNGKDFDGKKIDVNSKEYVQLLESVMNVDEVVKYFATHSFLVQNDNMFVTQQNYALYVDETGKCMVLPWDYDLSFGCFYPSTAETTANFDID